MSSNTNSPMLAIPMLEETYVLLHPTYKQANMKMAVPARNLGVWCAIDLSKWETYLTFTYWAEDLPTPEEKLSKRVCSRIVSHCWDLTNMLIAVTSLGKKVLSLIWSLDGYLKQKLKSKRNDLAPRKNRDILKSHASLPECSKVQRGCAQLHWD